MAVTFTRGTRVPSQAQSIVVHALATFESEAKAWLWLERPNALLRAVAPIQLLRTDPASYELVEDVLTRIDYGVFVQHVSLRLGARGISNSFSGRGA